MIKFLKYRYFCYFLSISFLVSGGIAYFVRGGFSYNVDFAGGTALRIAFEKAVEIGDLRNAMTKNGWQNSSIQSIGSDGKTFLIQVDVEIGDDFASRLGTSFVENKIRIDSKDWVGPEVGKDIKWNAIKAVLLSLLLILLYIAIRSTYRYAVGAVVAIAHDMLVVLAAFLLLNEPMSIPVLAAVLAVLGYSINDTIVIFSRIRENFVKMKGVTEEEIVNISLNQTLRRTMLTSFSTLLAVLSIFFLGGEALKGFSLTMMIGVIVGTYSSIFIASPIMLAIGDSPLIKLSNEK